MPLNLTDLMASFLVKIGKYDKIQNEIDEWQPEILALPTGEAVNRAVLLLGDPAKFQCDKAPPSRSERDVIEQFQPGLRSFFETFKTVKSATEGIVIGRAYIGSSEVNPVYVKIGIDSEHTELAAKNDQEAVYLLADDRPVLQSIIESFPSIYHYLLYIDRLLLT